MSDSAWYPSSYGKEHQMCMLVYGQDKSHVMYRNSVIFQMCVNGIETKTVELRLGLEPMVF